MENSGAGGKQIHEKNQKQKISWHCPFNKHGIAGASLPNHMMGEVSWEPE